MRYDAHMEIDDTLEPDRLRFIRFHGNLGVGGILVHGKPCWFAWGPRGLIHRAFRSYKDAARAVEQAERAVRNEAQWKKWLATLDIVFNTRGEVKEHVPDGDSTVHVIQLLPDELSWCARLGTKSGWSSWVPNEEDRKEVFPTLAEALARQAVLTSYNDPTTEDEDYSEEDIPGMGP
ncbi:hypothetical protein GCM10011611_54800 [Aliidongia dinghuensis]|uniref:Uncharacterized protein n=1 Tax=Aliidongia dinghuensis TaxID=1867774 RepID=A0A8J2YZQ2_9PROT|nr:hypothetical protein [Aliidongia dinghuensis]GGF41405.1 hypothetical protein GCM10011611_54800 [Aliidongia dinghuensis]